MRSTGIVRKVDDLGRIVLPKEMRVTKGFDIGTPLEIFVSEGAIILKKYNKTCVFCNGGAEKELNNLSICDNCIEKIKVMEG